MEKTFKIELTAKDFYGMLENRIYDDVDWERMNPAEKAQFKKTLLEGIEKQLAKSSYLETLKDYLKDMYEETDMEEFQGVLNQASKEANKRIDAEDKAVEEQEKHIAKMKEEKKEKALLEKLQKKYAKPTKRRKK